MILLFEPAQPHLRWCMVEKDAFSEKIIKLGPEWNKAVIDEVNDLENIDAIGYFFPRAGEDVKKTANYLDSNSLLKFEKYATLFPDYNQLIYDVAHYWLTHLPGIPQFLFCDTAFFSNVPPEAGAYAITPELSRRSVKRYCGDGLCHEWALEKSTSSAAPVGQNVLSLVISEKTNIAAIKNGRAIESTIGFTAVEGIPSLNSCGDIDPSIIFQLAAGGMSLEEINHLLSVKSGLCGLLGRTCQLSDMMSYSENPEIVKVQEIYRYSIVKYMGAFMSILDGVDTVLFSCERPKETEYFIRTLCREMEFLGARLKSNPTWNKKITTLSDDNSSIKIMCIEYNRWKIMAEKISKFEGEK